MPTVVSVIMRLAVLVEHRLVTDGQTDRLTKKQTESLSINRASEVSHGKNVDLSNTKRC